MNQKKESWFLYILTSGLISFCLLLPWTLFRFIERGDIFFDSLFKKCYIFTFLGVLLFFLVSPYFEKYDKKKRKEKRMKHKAQMEEYDEVYNIDITIKINPSTDEDETKAVTKEQDN